MSTETTDLYVAAAAALVVGALGAAAAWFTLLPPPPPPDAEAVRLAQDAIKPGLVAAHAELELVGRRVRDDRQAAWTAVEIDGYPGPVEIFTPRPPHWRGAGGLAWTDDGALRIVHDGPERSFTIEVRGAR